MFSLRMPAVAGRFYPATPEALHRELERCHDRSAHPAPALAVIAPHAGYVFSGAIAGKTFAQVTVPRIAIVLCPNHTGLGSPRALWPEGAWRVPGGDLPVDDELAERLRLRAGLDADATAHHREHAVEVHLPFLRRANPDVRIVPVCLGGLSPRACLSLGDALAEVVSERLGEVLLVASTDMSHFCSAEQARTLDRMALDHVEALDAEGLYQTVTEHEISMCGMIPTAVVLAATRALGAQSARLVRYGHPGEASGDLERVVGYAGLVIERGA